MRPFKTLIAAAALSLAALSSPVLAQTTDPGPGGLKPAARPNAPPTLVTHRHHYHHRHYRHHARYHNSRAVTRAQQAAKHRTDVNNN